MSHVVIAGVLIVVGLAAIVVDRWRQRRLAIILQDRVDQMRAGLVSVELAPPTGPELGQAIVVDNSPGMRANVCRVLEGEGYEEVMEAVTGSEALARLGELPSMSPVVLAIVDHDAPERHDFVRTVRSDPDLGSMRIVMLMPAAVQAPSRLPGVDDYLQKPFTEAALIEKLRPGTVEP